MNTDCPIESLAIVTPFYPPHVGGVERYAQEFARAAADLGLTVNVITTDAVRRPLESTDDGVRVLRLPAYNLPMMGSTYPISLSGWHRAAELLRCDAVMAHTRFFMTTPIAAVLAARQGRRICVVDHGSGPLRSSSVFALASLAYEHAVTSALKRLSPRFFAVSGASADWLRRFNINDAQVVPNGIRLLGEAPSRAPDAFAMPVVFFAGRLIPEKGARQLVEAVERLVREGSNIQLRIAGQGPLSRLLSERASEAGFLKYLGQLSPEQVAAEMASATIFVNPSDYPEGLPTTLLEAGAAALPVISTPRGGSVDLIRNGVTGWLIPDNAPGSIASALREVLAQPDEALRRGLALFSLVRDRYTWPSIVKKFLAYAGSANSQKVA
ncbi:MAG TPA: glycosyltransferase family 4 protein [Candidatus Cybelea sp.]